jgi:hypothetical protein
MYDSNADQIIVIFPMIMFNRSLNVAEDIVIQVLFINLKTGTTSMSKNEAKKKKEKEEEKRRRGGILVIVQHWTLKKLEWIGNSFYINRILQKVLKL